VTTPKRPSLADTLARIDALLELPMTPPTIEQPATGPWVTETTNPGPRSVVEALLTEHVAPDGHELVYGEPDTAPRFGATPGSCGRCHRANGVTTHCQIPAEPGTGLCRFHTQPTPVGLRTVAEASAELLGRHRPPVQPPAPVEPDRGWLARALRRLFGGAS
jgi:hypothetical protein